MARRLSTEARLTLESAGCYCKPVGYLTKRGTDYVHATEWKLQVWIAHTLVKSLDVSHGTVDNDEVEQLLKLTDGAR